MFHCALVQRGMGVTMLRRSMMISADCAERRVSCYAAMDVLLRFI
jgi:hypothetical protein